MSEATSTPLPNNSHPVPDARTGGWGERFRQMESALAAVSDRLNPILVKETRQALKSRQFGFTFVLLLILCWVVTIGGVAMVGPGIYYSAAGSILLKAYFFVLIFPLAVVVPFTAYRSLTTEREENTYDLLRVSTLNPHQVVRGKLGSAAVLMGVYLSAVAPCVAFTYLLRGVDVLSVAVLLLYITLASLGLSLIGLFLASITNQKHGQVLVSVSLVAALLGCFFGGIVMTSEFLDDGGQLETIRMLALVNLAFSAKILGLLCNPANGVCCDAISYAPAKVVPLGLTDEQWAILEPLLPADVEGLGRPREVDYREVINAILYLNRSGCQWDMLPHDLPPKSTVYDYFAKWRDDGSWQQMMDELRTQVRLAAGREPTPSAASVDSQSVKTTATGGERGYDGGKKVTGRKRHIFVDTLGLLLAVTVTAASVDDAAGIPPLFTQVVPEQVPRLAKVWADSKYHNYALKGWMQQERPEWDLEIVSRPKDTKGFVLLAKRWVVERTFSWNDRCRRHSKDYERRTDSSEAMIKVTAIGLMLRRLAPSPTASRFNYSLAA